MEDFGKVFADIDISLDGFIAGEGASIKEPLGKFAAISITGAAILTFPVWLVTFLPLPDWLIYLLLPFQVSVSFLQVKLGHRLYSTFKTRNKHLQSDAATPLTRNGHQKE